MSPWVPYICMALWLAAGARLFGGEPIGFSRDVRPILSDHCFKCHGPDDQTREAGLRLDGPEGLFADRGGYAAFVPGRPGESEALRRITSSDPSERMPPPDANLALSPQKIDVLRRWVEQGAVWEQHWAFTPVERPALPAVSEPGWCRTGIDRFILARLDAEGLRPSPEAPKEELIRRVTLDLTGLPPTPAEVDAFLEDDSPEAYERVVDRLLDSMRYGEHMALTWLDAARYADTDGYQNDGPREMWRWRDWVIEAYNANLPFDQFTIEQVAGDLLPAPTLEQRIATGFNRNHRYNSEAGLVLEEFLLENAVDRVDTTATVWMGLTLGCARCHDHKYDPFSTKEYYQLIAFFENVSESGRAVKFGNSEPWILAPTREQEQQLAEHDRRVKLAAEALAGSEEQIAAALAIWEGACTAAWGSEPLISTGLTDHFTFDGDDEGVTPEKGKPVFDEGFVGQAASVGGRDQFALGAVGDVQCEKRSSVAFWLRPEDVREGVILSRQSPNTTRPGLAVELRDGRLQFYIVGRWLDAVGAVEAVAKLEPGRWVHVCLTNDGSQSARGMQIYLDGRPAKTRILYNTNSNTGGTAKNAILRIGGGVHGPHFRGRVDELRFYDRTLWEDEVALFAVAETVEEILAIPVKERTADQRQKLRGWFLEHAAPPDLRETASEYFAARMARRRFEDSLPTTMVMDEMDPPRATHVRVRGVYNQLGQPVERDVPAAFPRLPADAPRNRLGFARWLVSGEHPLTARVTVNRYWQKYFGTGLVKTSEDFGLQGESPSHPELLDWLADEFVASGWDVKAMQKLIVMSAVYRQSSRVTPELLQGDPENRLLARGPRLRLPAHTLRDQALFVSGLLVETPGGPSVSPYQPASLWEQMSNMKYSQSKGADLYRRSLYTIWKRTVAPPSLAVLDAADRENCAVLPKRTNTPLQALTLLNETAFVESARQLGQRMIGEGGNDPAVFAFRLVTSREPTSDEAELLRSAREEYLADFRANPKAAAKLIRVGESNVPAELDPVELAANTALANLLLNLDEVVTKE